MTDHHVSVEMDNSIETQRDRSRSRDRSSTESPGPRKSLGRAVQEAKENDDDRPDILNPGARVDAGLLSTDVDRDTNNGPTVLNGGPIPSDEIDDQSKPRRPSMSPSIFNRPKTIMIDGIETQVPDANAYQHKKTLAQGMMDLALLSANANQLRYVLESYNRHPFFYPSLIFISLSIIVQVAVGVGLILNSQYNINDQREICKANRISNMTIIGIFIITVINVFVSSFGVADAPTA